MATKFTRRPAAPWIVLVTALLLTGIATAAAAATVQGRMRARFANAVQSTRDRIDARLGTYVALLDATAAFHAADVDVDLDRRRFAAYTARLGLRERYPGVQGIGFSRRMQADERVVVEQRLRSEGDPGFRVWPEAKRDDYHAIVHLEPLDDRNRAALGFDMFTEPIRRDAMSRARDSGTAAASGRVHLVQEIDARKQPGFLIYVPVYHGGTVPTDVATRRERLAGFVYAPFRADDLFEGIFGREGNPRVAFRIHDGRDAAPETLLHDSRVGRQDEGAGLTWLLQRAARLDTTEYVDNAGRPWTLVFTGTPALGAGIGSSLVSVTALTGLAMSAALFLLVRASVNGRLRVERIAGDREALARELQLRNDELASANRAKSDFLATMSHEIRTPINAIIGYTGLLELGMAGPVTPEQRIQLARVSASSTHLLHVVDDILDVSRIEAGRLHVAPERLDARHVMESALTLVRPQAEAKGLTLTMRHDAPPDAALLADEQRVQQILGNLLTNAVKFTPRGGHVRITCAVADAIDGLPEGSPASGAPAPGAPGPWLRFAVEDTGIGIAPELLPRVFEPFEQGERGYVRAHGGAGLGLAISRRLAHLMGGELTVRSEVGVGSCFVLWLSKLESGKG